MTRTIVGGIAAGALAFGILTGTAATIVVRDATTPSPDVSSLTAGHMGGASMGGVDMGSMMTTAEMMSGAMGAGSSAMPMDPGAHAAHHPLSSPEVAP